MKVTVTRTCQCSSMGWFRVRTHGEYEEADRVRQEADEALAEHAAREHPGQSRLRRWWRQRDAPWLR